MKKITAEEFYTLIEKVVNEYPRGTYWETRIVEETRWEQVVDEAAFDNSSFGGYGAGSIPMTSRPVIEPMDKSVVCVAKLLRMNGYFPEIFPIDTQKECFDTNGCTNQFETQSFSDDLMENLVWTLVNNKLSSERFDKILTSLTFESLIILYQSNIHGHQKDKIYRFNRDCDSKRKLCDEITSLFAKVDSKKHTSADKFSECKQGYDEIETFLEENTEQLDEKYQQFILQLERCRLDLAKKVADVKQYALAEIIYIQILEKTTTDKVKARCCLNLGIQIYNQAQDYDRGIQYLETYKKLLGKADPSYWTYKALIRIAQRDMKSTCINLLNLGLIKNEQDLQLWRAVILGHLNEESFTNVLDALLELAKNKSDKNHVGYKNEYLAYIQLGAEKNHRVAQYRLYVLLRESDAFLAEMWLERSAKQGYLPARHLLLRFYKDQYLQEEDKESKTSEHSYKKMRAIVKKSDDETSKKVMRGYYKLLLDSYASDEPKKKTDQKRKAFCDAVEENAPTPPESPFEIPQHTPSDFELHMDSDKPSKRVRIQDTTDQMVRPVKEAYNQDKSKNKRNYLAANLSLIFSDPGKTKRYVRTVAIIGSDHKTTINLEDLHPTSSAEHSQKVSASLNEKHKKVIASSHAIYKTVKRRKLPGAQELKFVEDTSDRKHNPYSYKHNEFALYEYLCRKTNLKRQLDKFIRENKEVFKKGSKVYGVVLDILTVNASCTDCKKLALTMQNDQTFSKTLEEVLVEGGFKCLTERRPGLFLKENKLQIQIRIRALKPLQNKNDSFADFNVIPAEKELKTLNGTCFFHKIEDLGESESPEKEYLIFESGTHATRPQATPT